jgi:transposase InsO family protein
VIARYRVIQELAAVHALALLCPLLGVARSGYYDWRQRTPSRRQREDAQLLVEVQAAFEHSRRTYGRPRLTRALRARGHAHGERRIGRLMHAAGLCARTRRRFVPQTTQSRHDGPIAPNRLAWRATPPTEPNQVWAVDMTYLATTEGWLFLAIVLDLHSRRIVGWAFAKTLHTTLPLAALRMALHQRQPPRGLLHHSDRGCQYASAEYRALLHAHGLEPSMSRTANPYDNAAVESFFATLKIECLHGCPITTASETQARLFDYLETFYNRQRLHSALGYLSPVDFENINH